MIDQSSRLALLALLEGKGEMGSTELGLALGKDASTVTQMMGALVAERLVGYRRQVKLSMGGFSYRWWRTDVPIPEVLMCSTAAPVHLNLSNSRADALSEAMGMGRLPLTPGIPSKVHRI